MNKEIKRISGKAIPLRGNDIDTDRIIPARFMKCLTFKGLGQFAFYDERFEEDGSERDHPLNKSKYKDYSIMVTNLNFGCGSSREHAPWALSGIGVKCIIAQSFAEIFAGNCSSLGIPALIAEEKDCNKIQDIVENNPQSFIDVDLEKKEISIDSLVFKFDISETYRLALIEGKWDTTSMLMENIDIIKERNNILQNFR